MKFIALLPFFCGFISSRELCPNVKIEYTKIVSNAIEDIIYNILPKDPISPSIVQDNNHLTFNLHEMGTLRALHIENKNNKSLQCTFAMNNILQFQNYNNAEIDAFEGNLTCNDVQLNISEIISMRTTQNRFMNTFGCKINPPNGEQFENMIILLIFNNEPLKIVHRRKFVVIFPFRFGHMIGLNLDKKDVSEEQKRINFKTKVTNCSIKKQPTDDIIYVYILLSVFMFFVICIVVLKILCKI